MQEADNLFRSVSEILLLFVALICASPVPDTTHAASVKADVVKSDSAVPAKKDSVSNKNDTLSKKSDTVSHQVAVVKIAKQAKPAVSSPPVSRDPVFKKTKKVREKSGQKFDAGKILVAISRKVPALLHTPGTIVKKAIDFTKKNLVKVLLLLIFCTVIVSTILFFRQRIEVKRFMTTTRLSVMDKEVQKACRFIESNYDDPELTVDKLCIALVTGSAFLTALFERELGMSVEDFISQVRVNRAKIMLKKDSSAEIDTVAFKSGFTDINQFKATFEKLCGVSFDDYRKSQLTDQPTM